mmetsp:Transcript_122197/g.356748  ORF Transcript_122197/g.356748 Transcript_122197/m.356748 type:complete len:203 (-) Transcript_122197:431-1039(-)
MPLTSPGKIRRTSSPACGNGSLVVDYGNGSLDRLGRARRTGLVTALSKEPPPAWRARPARSRASAASSPAPRRPWTAAAVPTTSPAAHCRLRRCSTAAGPARRLRPTTETSQGTLRSMAWCESGPWAGGSQACGAIAVSLSAAAKTAPRAGTSRSPPAARPAPACRPRSRRSSPARRSTTHSQRRRLAPQAVPAIRRAPASP